MVKVSPLGRKGISRSPFLWLRTVVLPLGLAVVDLCWLYPWLLVWGWAVDHSGGVRLLSPFSAFVLLLAGQLATRYVLGRGWTLARVRLLLIGLGLLVVLLIVRLEHYPAAPGDLTWLGAFGADLLAFFSGSPPVIAACVGLLLWWRGMANGRSAVNYEGMNSVFALGLVANVLFLLLTLFMTPVERGLLEERAGVFLLFYFLAGLPTLALARLDSVRERSRTREGASQLGNWQWLGVLLGLVLGLIIFALLVGGVLSSSVVGAVIAPLLAAAGEAFWFVSSLVIWAIAILLAPLMYLIRLLAPPLALPEATPEPDFDPSQLGDSQATVMALPPEVLLALRVVAVAALVGVALLLLARTISRRRDWSIAADYLEEHDSVWTWRSLRDGLLARLRAWLAALRRPARGSADRPLAASDVEPARATSALGIRQIYAQLLRLGASLGLRRRPSETPYEHLPALAGRLVPPEDLAAITAAYVEARYGALPPSEARVQEVREAWRRVQASPGQGAAGDGEQP
ncbi:MAG: DUF4129 domain-containing protein [Dehalococcoidales bacterium]|nr:DUF4129 domain-containing protein [Dehalococcoidales bacterium]